MFCNCLFQWAVLSDVWSIFYTFYFVSENREAGVRFSNELPQNAEIVPHKVISMERNPESNLVTIQFFSSI